VFVGRHERQLDPKGRLALPSAFRPRFEPRCYLALGRDGCIDVFTPEAFEQMATETMDKVRRGEVSRDEQRALASRTFEVAVDTQGRVNVDRELREFAGLGLGTRVVVAGSFDRVEIWNSDLYEQVVARGGASWKGAEQ
jgi:MraZ protein